jgi:hypothetical protein
MSLSASRMYRGLVKYPETVVKPGEKLRRGETSWFAGSSDPNDLAEGNHGAGCASPNSEVFPRSPTQDWFGTRLWGSDIA